MRWHPRTQKDGRIILIPKRDFTLDNLGKGGLYMAGEIQKYLMTKTVYKQKYFSLS